jgi:hypothetical protein
MNKKYPYTEKYTREQLEKANPNLYVKKSKINRKKLIATIFGTLVILFVIGIWNYRTEKHLRNNGVQTTATISSIKSEYRRINDLELTRIHTYSIEYKFLYNSDTVSGLDIIRKEELNEYFDNMPKVNDSIEILYDIEKIEHSSIKKK